MRIYIIRDLIILYAAGRAVLIDYYSFVNESYDPLTTHPIPLTGILECAKAQNVQFQIGDILLIRSGFVSKYLQLNKEERQELGAKGLTDYCFAGVEQTEDMVDFLHDNYFAAVAGDAPAFESWPTDKGISILISCLQTLIFRLVSSPVLAPTLGCTNRGNVGFGAPFRSLQEGR